MLSKNEYSSQKSKSKKIDNVSPEEESEEEKDSRKLKKNSKKKKLPKVLLNTSRCRGDLKLMKKLVAKNAEYGWKEVFGMDGDIMWSGLQLDTEDIQVAEYILLNRIPCMNYLAYKKTTGFFLNKFREYFPDEYDFFPRTYLLPEETNELEEYLEANPDQLFIAKPTASCQGDGIVLIRKIRDIPQIKLNLGRYEMIAQTYIEKPLLIDNKKFDLRLYLLISSVKPLIAYLCDEGLARFCTENYEIPNSTNIKNKYMHLTNYSLNKMSPNFKHTDETTEINDGSKRTLCSLWKSVEKAGHNKDKILEGIEELICKFLVSMKPFIHLHYNNAYQGKDKGKCFHLIGFDVLIDQDLKPWLLEINANPSLAIDFEIDNPDGTFTSIPSEVDYYVKSKAVEDALVIVKTPLEDQKELSRYGSYKQVYNSEDSEYEDFDLIQDLLDIFNKLSGTRLKSSLTLSKFSKLGSHALLTNEKLPKAGYELIFTKLVVRSGNKLMDFEIFIQAIELIAEKLYSDFNKEDKAPFITKLISTIKSVLQKKYSRDARS